MKKYPFKFLNAYDQNDTDIFFGREEETKVLYDMVFQNSVVLVYGASGSGKTSLIQCGLSCKFKSYDWLPITIRRGNNINESLKDVLLKCVENPLYVDAENTSEEARLAAISKMIRNVYLFHFRPVYLVFDQLEELYILGSKDEQEKFISSVQEILKAEQPVKLIFSIREDYLGYLDRFEKAVPQLMRKKLRLEAMTNDELTGLLTGINNYQNSNVSIKADELEGISEEIFNKLKGDNKTLTIELPYLQILLDKIYLKITNDNTHQADALITKENVLGVKSIETVLADFMEEEVTKIAGGLNAADNKITKNTIWQVLSPFATLEGTKEPIKKSEYQNRINNADVTQQLVNICITRFAECRILSYSEKTERFELAHDSLAKYIAGKRSKEEIKLLETARLIKHQAAVKVGVREFFTARQLSIIKPLLSKLNLTAEENKLVEESVQAEQKKRLRYFATVGIAAILICGFVLWLNRYYQQQENNRLRISNLTKYKRLAQKSLKDQNYLQAFLYSTEALALEKDNLKYDSLIKIAKDTNNYLFAAYTLQNYLPDTSAVIYASFGPGDTTIYTWTDNGILTEWDLYTGKKLRVAKVKFERVETEDEQTKFTYQLQVFSSQQQNTIQVKDTLVNDSINYFKKRYVNVVVNEMDKSGLPNFPTITLKLSGAVFSKDNNSVVTWGRNTESMYDAANIWDRNGYNVGSSLIHDGITGAAMNAGNTLLLTWGIDNNIRVWKHDNDTAIYNLPPALIKLKARLETGVEISPVDNSIKIINAQDYRKRKDEYENLVKEFMHKKK